VNFLLWASLAGATTDYDPSTPVETFTGQETFTQDGEIPLWSAIERHTDPNVQLFSQESFNQGIAWQDGEFSPWMKSCFGTGTPASSDFLLHIGPNEASASGTPILLVPGAGDNGSRGFVTLATKMDQAGRPVYAITFAHPHGDVFMQAEAVADAIARIQVRTGAAQVDVVSHSKGGIASAVYLSHHSGADWDNTAYSSHGTQYRGDVRRAVFIGTPLGGVDTLYRWSGNNYAALDADTTFAPSSWSAYYQYGTSAPAWVTDLSDQDMLADGADIFPGQRQILARQDHPLPGSMPWLGIYAVQQDWYTTYEGGYGFYSYSEGIDDAVVDGGELLAHLADNGADPSVEVFLLAGTNPLMPNATETLLAQVFGQAWVDLSTSSTDQWAALLAEAVGSTLEPFGLAEQEVQGLAQGKLLLGEITGPSDGVVFTDSATYGAALTARGSVIQETRTANLSHLDLLYASTVTGSLLIAQGNADPQEDGWMTAVGARYQSEDTLGWVQDVLADPEPADTGDSGDTADTGLEETGGETGDTGPSDSAPSGMTSPSGGDCRGGCSNNSGPVNGALLGLILFLVPLLRQGRSGSMDTTT
jgi:triacylglycerol lipase